MNIEVRQKRIDEDRFLKMRENVLSLWPIVRDFWAFSKGRLTGT